MKLARSITKLKNKNNQQQLFYPETTGNKSMKVEDGGLFGRKK
jgi:hypothetical protein